MALAWPVMIIVHPIAAPPWALGHGGPWHQVCTFLKFKPKWGCWCGGACAPNQVPPLPCPPPTLQGVPIVPHHGGHGQCGGLSINCTHLHPLEPLNFDQKVVQSGFHGSASGASPPPCPPMPIVPGPKVGARHGASAPTGDCIAQWGAGLPILFTVDQE